MTTDGAGSKQMSTSWQTDPEWSDHRETGGHSGTQWGCSDCGAKQESEFRAGLNKCGIV